MRHTDTVLVEDNETGSHSVVELGYLLPYYNIGELVFYRFNDGEEELGPAEIVGIEMMVNFNKSTNQYETDSSYRLDDHSLVDENEITSCADDVLVLEDVEEEHDAI